MNDHDDMIEREPEELSIAGMGNHVIAYLDLPISFVYHVIAAVSALAFGALLVYRFLQ